MLFPNSCRCSVGGETFRLSSQSSRFRYPYSAPLFFLPFFFFTFSFSPWEVVSYVCMFLFFFATHHPPVITTCSWGSVGHFRPWTHTSDDSYIYQLSLVVATATVSYIFKRVFNHMRYAPARGSLPTMAHISVPVRRHPQHSFVVQCSVRLKAGILSGATHYYYL